MFGFFMALWYRRKIRELEERFEEASEKLTRYVTSVRTLRKEIDTIRPKAEALTDEGKLEEAEKYWDFLAERMTTHARYVKNTCALEFYVVALKKIIEGLRYSIENSASDRYTIKRGFTAAEELREFFLDLLFISQRESMLKPYRGKELMEEYLSNEVSPQRLEINKLEEDLEELLGFKKEVIIWIHTHLMLQQRMNM